jgi:CDP-diacylglycerol--serine O-phosphatidyltransferase
LSNKWALYAIVFLLCYLMVSNISIMALKFRDFSLKNNYSKIILLIAAVFAAIFLKWLAIPVLFLFYIMLSLIFKNKTT